MARGSGAWRGHLRSEESSALSITEAKTGGQHFRGQLPTLVAGETPAELQRPNEGAGNLITRQFSIVQKLFQ